MSSAVLAVRMELKEIWAVLLVASAISCCSKRNRSINMRRVNVIDLNSVSKFTYLIKETRKRWNRECVPSADSLILTLSALLRRQEFFEFS